MAEHSEKTLTVADLGERGTLARILPLLPSASGMSVGPGDDSAVVGLNAPEVVTTCDMMVEGPDFRRDWSQPEDIGYKAMSSNLADISAMGARPLGVIIGLAAPPDTPVSDLVGIARGVAKGLADMAPEAGVLGGDLSTAAQLTLSVTVLGQLFGLHPVLRSGAQPGDIVAVTGEPGVSERGFRILNEHTTQAGGVLDPSVLAELRRQPEVLHHLAPRIDLAHGPAAAQAQATAMMDVSDGLVLDATRMAEASDVAIDFDGDAVVDDAWLMGGEDHGLLATFPPEVTLPEGFHAVGVVRDYEPSGDDVGTGDVSTGGVSTGGSPTPRVTVSGVAPDIERGGWDPYRDSVKTRVSP